MKKFPVTLSGIAELQAELYQQNDAVLLKEASDLAADFLSWAAGRLELEVYLLEELRNLPMALRLQLGWCMATSIVGRRTIIVENRMAERKNLPIKDISFQISFSAAFASRGQESISKECLKIIISH